MPVLPGPDGDKPPPLFPGLAAKTFTMLGFKSFLHGVKMNSIRDSTYENRENQSYGSATRMIKVVVCGKPGMIKDPLLTMMLCALLLPRNTLRLEFQIT